MSHAKDRAAGAHGQEKIVLPPPCGTAGAAPRKEALDTLSLAELSTLLWTGTAFRRQRHGRAALPPHLYPLVQLYAVLPDGAYRYDPVEHSLVLVTSRDLRRWIGPRAGMRTALDLLYVDDSASQEEGEWEECGTVAGADTDHIAQGVAAHCARAGLAASVASRVAPQLAAALGLSPPGRIALAQRIAVTSAGPH